MRTTKLPFTVSLVALVALPLLAAPREEARPREEVMTNADVVALVRAGLSEEVILSKIAVSPSEFDISTDAILDLKRQAIPEAVIGAMVVHGSGGMTRVPDLARTSWSNSNPLRVTLESDGRTEALEARTPRDRYINTFVGMLWFKRLKGAKASTRSADGKVAIRIPRAAGDVAVNMDGVHLVKLDVDREDEIRQYRLDFFGPFGGVLDMDPEEDFIVETDSVEEGGSILITPERPLRSGEYALVDERHLVYDFGVD